MLELDICKFCDEHNACASGRDWALINCKDMADAWDKLPPTYLLWVATCEGVLSAEQLTRLAHWVYTALASPFGVELCVATLWDKAKLFGQEQISYEEYIDAMDHARGVLAKQRDGRDYEVNRAALKCCVVPVDAAGLYDAYDRIERVVCQEISEGLNERIPCGLVIGPSALSHMVGDFTELCVQAGRDWLRNMMANFIRRTFGNPF